MEFPTQHEDLKLAWLYLRDKGQAEHAETIFQFAQMFKDNYEQMRRMRNLADNLQRQSNQEHYEEVRRQTIKRHSGSRRAANE
jgi:hypothetical protein